MKAQIKYWLIAVIGLITSVSFSQNNNWAWMHGSATTVSLTPVYGSIGVSSPLNSPGARRSPVTITDNSGNLWLFGGMNNAGNYMSDLWKFNISNNEWVWMKGANTPNNMGVYGTQGTASSTNTPGGRYFSCGWADNSGNLWIFGGIGYSSNTGPSYLNDLWRYTIATNQWTWMKGVSIGTATYGTYGAIGISSPINTPGGRYSCAVGKDNNNNFWLFGGTGYGSSTSGSMNDLWKYNTTTNTWTWMNGVGVSNQFSSFGTQGVASASATPGGRYAASGCSDASGNLWVFGGYGMINGGTGYLNELWKYNTTTGQWVWYEGSPNANQSGSYGTQGVASSNNFPGSRIYYTNSSLVDLTGNFWLFGGYGYSSGGTGYMNDMWRYNASTNQWVWMKGSASQNQYGQYGTQGVGVVSNSPGSRYMQSSWKDNSGNFWVYGGIGYSGTSVGDLSDLWKLDVCAIPADPISSSVPGNLLKCSGSTTTLSATSGTTAISWYSSPASTLALASGSNYITSPLSSFGTSSVYIFYAEAMTCGPSATRTAISVTINPTPTITVNSGTVCQGGVFAILPSGAATYTFSGGAQLVSPATNTSYLVSGTSQAGCPSTANAVSNVIVHPSPAISVSSGTICAGSVFTINTSGAASYTFSNGSSTVSPSVSSFYFVTGTSSLGCTSQSPAVSAVVVSPNPTISVSSGSICNGSNFLISPTGASTYTISGGAASVSPSVTTSYTVVGANSQGCLASNQVVCNVVVHPSPTLSVNDGTICSGDSFTIVPSGAVNYTFVNTSSVVSPTVTSSYTVIGNSLQGCVGNPALLTVNVNAIPSLTLNTTSTLVCLGESPISLNGLPAGGIYSGTNVSGNMFNPLTVGVFMPTYSYTSATTNCKNTIGLAVFVNLCTDIDTEKQSELGINLFPNPNNGAFTISSNSFEKKVISITDIVGRSVYNHNSNEQNIVIDISNFAKGIYYVSVNLDKELKVIKVVKE